ncbi:hypothetical protein BGZ80_000773 [Entomortierella chlamydospora]|uniref:WD40 repeat-like protein n=1 Tax=Entomortierella chlamydospora TaxID=101097 RepID=A0A9P6N1Y6_9FUNG|nr:hypothetical protein BGZ80_000773 [Entomortierella chlamydospora]
MRHSAPTHDKQGAHSKAHHGHPAKTEHPAVMLATGSEQNIEHELHKFAREPTQEANHKISTMPRNPFASHKNGLSVDDALELASHALENARKAKNKPAMALQLCNDAKSKIKDAENIFGTKKDRNPTLGNSIAIAYHEHGKLLNELGYHDKALRSHNKAEKWGYVHAVSQCTDSPQPTSIQLPTPAAAVSASSSNAATVHQDLSETRHFDYQDVSQDVALTEVNKGLSAPKKDVEQVPRNYFEQDVILPVVKYDLPDPGGRITSTPQLAYCLTLISPSLISEESLDENERDWLQGEFNDPDTQERLREMATDLIREFVRDELKKHEVVTEVVSLAAVLEQEDFERLLQVLVGGINKSLLLEDHLVDGLAQLIRNAPQRFIDADDLVKILELLHARLKDIHKQSVQRTYQLTRAISQVLDSMVDSQVDGLSRESLHEPLSNCLKELKELPKDSDPYLTYQAAYAYQALLYVPDDESILQSMMRRTGKVVQGISGVVAAVKALDVVGFVEGLQGIQEGLAGTGKAIELVNNAYEDIKALTESGQGLLESLKEGFSFERKSSWYPALRGLDSLLQGGRFKEFEKLIRESPCRRNPAFQWGVCQRLGEIASNPIWGIKIRKCAVSFLLELYNDDSGWACQTFIKQWILCLLDLSTQSLQGITVDDTQKLLQEVRAVGSTDRLTLRRDTEKYGTTSYPMMFTPPSQESPLLNRVQNKPDVETPLSQLKRERLQGRGGDVYISPRAKSNPRATDDFDLTSKVQEFLESKRKVFLILGDSGAGKSTFNRALEISLWDKYKVDGRIPLFISLPTIEKPERDMIAKRLRQANFTEGQIRELKLHREFILICDGYDEIQETRNLYITNQLNQSGGWRVQMLISCRTEYNSIEYKDCFQPTERNNGGDGELFQEASITPFNENQIRDYIDQYVRLEKPTWGSEDYQQALKQIRNLQDLVKNPFLLKIALEVLPQLFNTNSQLSKASITRLHLYDEFVAQWIKRSRKRLIEINLNSRDKEVFQRMNDSGFKGHGIAYFKELVTAIYDNQSGNPVVNYLEYRDRRTWKEEFFSDRDGKRLLREAIPLTRNGDQYRFIHKSVLEYGIALAVYDPNERNENTEPMPAVSRRGSTGSALSFEQPSKESTSTANEDVLLNSPLGKKTLVDEPSILQFLSERVKQQPIFKDQLHSIIERSKTDKSVRIASANSITILVRAGVQFNNADLRNIKIPGADLSFGVFDSARLEGADLRKVNLRNVWMRQANLREAQMAKVQFGELPFIKEGYDVHSCAYSPDGKILTVGLSNGYINLRETSSRDIIRILKGHSRHVWSLSFSMTGNRIVSGSEDKTIRLWDVDNGDCIRTLLGHTSAVRSVAYSPKGTRIASGSLDKTVRIWDDVTGECIFTLQDHNERVMSVAFSPMGDRIASGSKDKTVRLWDADTGDCVRTLQCHTSCVKSVTFSPKGDRLASGSDDKTVRLWDVDTGDCVRSMQGHTSNVNSVAYSRKGDRLISGSDDKSIRLWDVGTGECLNAFRGHSHNILSVAYSPNGDQIASGGVDETVRLWNVDIFDYTYTLQAHRDSVRSVAFSSRGDQIASGSMDNTVRLWDVNTGDCLRTLEGHTGPVKSVTYSPNGNRLASGSVDKTVRLWDVDTGECLNKFEGHNFDVQNVVYSLKGDWIASASRDKTIRLWDIDTGKNIKTLLGHTGELRCIAISPKGDRITSGGSDKTVRLWDVDTACCIHTLLGHSNNITSIAYSPKGDQIASGSFDRTVRLWDVDTGNCIRILQGHISDVCSLAFSPNGDRIVSGGDISMRFWRVETGECLATISSFGGEVFSIDWSDTSDDQYLITGSDDNSVRRWRFVKEKDEYKAILCWNSPHESLTMYDVSFEGVQDLSHQNRDLLIQRKGMSLVNSLLDIFRLASSSRPTLAPSSPLTLAPSSRPTHARQNSF